MIRLSNISERFRARFGGIPRVFRAPGRVNLIGEHTDYNDGFAMPAAIEFYCWAAIGPREDREFRIYSEEFSAAAEVNLGSTAIAPTKSWSDYPIGVALELEKAGFRIRGGLGVRQRAKPRRQDRPRNRMTHPFDLLFRGCDCMDAYPPD